MNNPFLQAVQSGDLMAAKAAFNQEMSSRVATSIVSMKTEIANSVELPEESISGETENE